MTWHWHQSSIHSGSPLGAEYFGMSGVEIGYTFLTYRDMGAMYRPVGAYDTNVEYHARSGKGLS